MMADAHCIGSDNENGDIKSVSTPDQSCGTRCTNTYKRCCQTDDCSEKKIKFNKELTRSRARVILEILPPLVMLGFTCLVQSMPSTYLPLYFRQEFHISESTSAIVISTTMFTYVISCLVSPVLDGYVDVNLVLITSYFLFLLSSIAFAFVDALPTNMVVGASIGMRALTGFSAGVFENSINARLVRRCDGRVGLVSALIEAAINGGYLAGPVLGGALYAWTDSYYKTTLIPLSVPVVLFVGFTSCAFRDVERVFKDDSVSSSSREIGAFRGFIQVIKSWQMSLLLFYPFYGTFIMALPTTITAPHTYDTFGSGPAVTGLIFLVQTVGYMSSTVISGFLTDMPRFKKYRLWSFAVCPFVMTIGCLLIGPAFFLPFKPSNYWIASGLFIASSAFGICCGPALAELLDMWKMLNPECAADYTSYILSILLVSFFMGEGAGNAVGGILYQYLGYNSLLTIFGFSLLLLGAINTAAVFYIRNKQNVKSIICTDEKESLETQ